MRLPCRPAPLLLSLLAGVLLAASTVAPAADKPSDVRRFEQALSALRQGDTARFAKLSAALRGDLLWPYLRYAELRANLRRADVQTVRNFLHREADLPIADSLRRAFLLELARRKDWQDFLALDTLRRNGTFIACARAQALAANAQKREATTLAQRLWLGGYSQPESCEPAFDLLRHDGRMPAALVERRLILALESGNARLARYLAGLLPRAARARADAWLAVWEDPRRLRTLPPASLGGNPAAGRVLTAALCHMGREQPAAAHALWARIDRRLAGYLTSQQQARIERTIAVFAAIDALPQGLSWLAALPPGANDAFSRAWRARAALRAGNWPQVLAAIRAMPEAQRRQDEWRYWEARALLKTGAWAKGRAVAEKLAQRFSYYGFLAADLVQRPYPRGPQPKAAAGALQRRVSGLRLTRLALALHEAGQSVWAGAVWRRLLQALKPEARLAAARVAADHDWAYGAYLAAASSPAWGASALTFPRAHWAAVKMAAADNDLAPDLVLALMRQESAFQATVCSAVGACGLMQLMPATACWIGQQTGQGRRWCSPQRLARPGVNIRAGSTYLGYLTKQFPGNLVAALAAYNAGPGTVGRWLSKPGLEADSARWIATLPYGETRSYIEQVLFNRVVYARLQPGRDAWDERLALRLDDLLGAGPKPLT